MAVLIATVSTLGAPDLRERCAGDHCTKETAFGIVVVPVDTYKPELWDKAERLESCDDHIGVTILQARKKFWEQVES